MRTFFQSLLPDEQEERLRGEQKKHKEGVRAGSWTLKTIKHRQQ